MKFIGNYKELIDEEAVKLPALPEQRNILESQILTFEPGKVEYTHTDQFLVSYLNPVKYFMFLTNWDIGHIFTYGDRMLSGYKAGDLYQITDAPETIYSWANIGYTTSRVLEIKTHNGDTL
jgi:hypothetical protein